MSDRLTELRKAQGLTRPEVAAKLDISERHLYRLEHGHSPLKRWHKLALADAYGVTIDEIERCAA